MRHILVKTKAQADKIYAQLKAGANFATLAKKYSLDPGSKDNGGKLTITRGQTVAPFDTTAFLLTTNQISKPVKTQYGYHVIQPISGVKPAKTTPLKDAKPQIEAQLLDKAKNDAITKWTDDVKKYFERRSTTPPGSRRPRRRPTRDDHRLTACRPPTTRARRGARRAAGADEAAAPRLPLGSRADRAHDRAAHGRGGLRGRRRGASRATTRSCSTSSATFSSRRTSSRSCSRSRARATSRPSPAPCTRSSSAATRTSSAMRRQTRRGACASAGRRSRPSRRAVRASSTTFPPRSRRCSTRARCSAARPRSASTGPASRAAREDARGARRDRRRARPDGRPAPETEADPRVFAEIGDLLFTVVNVARRRECRPRARLARDERPLRRARRARRASLPPRPARRGRARPRRAGALVRPRQEAACRDPAVDRLDSTVSAIVHVHARQVLDSRGNPTVEVEVGLDSGAFGRAAVPSGASTGEHEAVELRDGGDAWLGKGVTPRGRARQRRDRRGGSLGLDAREQREIDAAMIELDGTPTKARLGANAILGVSLAVAKAAAAEAERAPLPVDRRDERARPAGAADERRQRRRARAELARLPGVHARARPAPSRSPRRSAIGVECYPRAQGVLKERGLSTSVGDEGGFAPISARPTTPARRSSRRPSGQVTARRSRSRSTRRRASSTRTASTCSSGRAARSTAAA